MLLSWSNCNHRGDEFVIHVLVAEAQHACNPRGARRREKNHVERKKTCEMVRGRHVVGERNGRRRTWTWLAWTVLFLGILDCTRGQTYCPAPNDVLNSITTPYGSVKLEIDVSANVENNSVVARSVWFVQPDAPVFAVACTDTTDLTSQYPARRAFLTALGINLGVLAIFVVLWQWARGWTIFEKVYVPLLVLKGMGKKLKNREFPEPPRKMFWVQDLIQRKEDDVAATGGLDALVYLRLLRIGWNFCLASTFIGWGLLVPITYTQGVDSADPSIWAQKFSVSAIVNVYPSLMWIHMIVFYLLSAYFHFLLHSTYRDLLMYRMDFMAFRQTGPIDYTVFITDILSDHKIPLHNMKEGVSKDRFFKATKKFARQVEADIQSRFRKVEKGITEEEVSAFLEDVYQKDFAECIIVPDTRRVIDLKRKRDKLMRGIEYRRDVLKKGYYKKWTGKTIHLSEGKRADLEEEVAERTMAAIQLHRLLEDERAEARRTKSITSFAAFNTQRIALQSSQTRHYHDGLHWRVSQAPDPEEIMWQNVALTWQDRALRKVVFFFAAVGIVILYVTLTAMATSLANLDEVVSSSTWSWLSFLTESSFVQTVFEALVPGACITGLLNGTALLVQFMSVWQGAISHAEVMRGAVYKMFWVLFVSIFLSTILSRSVFNSTFSAVFSSISVEEILQSAALATPGSAMVLLLWVIGRSMIGMCLELCRWVWLFFYLIYTNIAMNESGRMRAWRVRISFYVKWHGESLIIVLLGIVFCVMNPMFSPFGLWYCLTCTVLWRNQFSFVYYNPVDTNGMLWPVIHKCLFAGMIVSQVLWIGYCWYAAVGLFVVSIFLPIFSVIGYFYTKATFADAYCTLSLYQLSMLDKETEQRYLAGSIASYYPPDMSDRVVTLDHELPAQYQRILPGYRQETFKEVLQSPDEEEQQDGLGKTVDEQ